MFTVYAVLFLQSLDMTDHLLQAIFLKFNKKIIFCGNNENKTASK